MNWTKKRLKKASIAERVATYHAIPASPYEEAMKIKHPGLFEFRAISIGDKTGQAFIVPLDESDRETAELILRAIQAYEGN